MRFARKTILDYLTITSGVLGRLVISLVYFLIVANVLTLGDFGIFASASAVGLVLSRVLAFGFVSPVFRVATVRPQLLGVYWAGLAACAAASLPIVAALAIAVHAIAFESRIGFAPFLLLVAAEVIGWRVVEFVVITLNGLTRFGRAAALVMLGSAIRTAAAILFFLSPWRGLDDWIGFYVAANAVSLSAALIWFFPRMRLRFAWRLYPRRMRDALASAVSDLTFYAQSELDKLLVLALAGDRTAGLYAIAMRLIDLTAIPVRSFNQLLVQRLMKDGGIVASRARRIGIEAAIAVVSTLGMAAFVILLWLHPFILGRNVAAAAPLLLPMLLIPALRNLVEYQAELLYARERVVTRSLLLSGLVVLKLALMAPLLWSGGPIDAWALPLTAVFAALYAASATVTYRTLPTEWR